MEWTPFRLLLALTMLTTGSLNTLCGKWADQSKAEGMPGYGVRTFNHPFFQAICMFVGEMLCGIAFIVIVIRRRRRGESIKDLLGKMTFNFKTILTEKGAFGKSFFVFFPPAMCDIAGTSLMYIGLNYTTAASYQMLRGSVIIFTALLSVAFLKRKINLEKWVGIFAVLAGLVVVGLSDFLFNPSTMDINAVLTGDELVIMGQVITAMQMIVEEKFLGQLDVHPLLAVGLEGLYGFTVLSILSIPMYWMPVGSQFSNSPEYRLEDMLDAFAMFKNQWQVWVPMLGMVLSLGFFNWAGVSVTKELSATTRMVIDSCRTLVIWAVTLAIGWQTFNYMQIIGFVVLTSGIFIYNEILTYSLLKDAAKCKCCKEADEEVDFQVQAPVRVHPPAGPATSTAVLLDSPATPPDSRSPRASESPPEKVRVAAEPPPEKVDPQPRKVTLDQADF